MRILVTGGTGFVGKAIVSRLLSEGHEVLITGCKSENAPIPGVKMLQLHFDGIAWEDVQNLDIVFHQAADNDTMGTDLKEMLKANLTAPMNLFQMCYNGGCRKFVYASSTATERQ
jgi:nucleoside-diphosphate-sugar epimerase